MPENINFKIILAPEYTALKEETEKLRSRASALITERDDLVFRVCPMTDTLYQVQFGPLEYKVYKAQCQYLRLKRKSEIILPMIRNGEDIDLKKIEADLDNEFKKYTSILKERLKKINRAIEKHTSMKSFSEAEISEVKNTYRSIVNKVHPVLCPHQSPEAKKLFLNAIKAYENMDIPALKAVEELSLTLEAPEERDLYLNLKHEKQKLANVIGALEKNIQDLKNKYPYSVKGIVEDEERSAKYKNDIEKTLHKYEEAIKAYSSHLSRLLGS